MIAGKMQNYIYIYIYDNNYLYAELWLGETGYIALLGFKALYL